MSDTATVESPNDAPSTKPGTNATNGMPVPPKRSRRRLLGEWVHGLDFLDALFVEPPSRSLEDCLRELKRIQAPLRRQAEQAAARAKLTPLDKRLGRSVSEALLDDLRAITTDFTLSSTNPSREMEDVGESQPVKLSPENTDILLDTWQQELLHRGRLKEREMTLQEERTRAEFELNQIRIASANQRESRMCRERMIARLIGSAILIGAMFLGAWIIDRDHDSAGVSFTLGVVAVIAAAYILGRHWVPTASARATEAEEVREPKVPSQE